MAINTVENKHKDNRTVIFKSMFDLHVKNI